MAVIITEMDMPKNCRECKISTKECMLWSELSIDDKCKMRHKDCPLKSVDGLIGKIEDYMDQKWNEISDADKAGCITLEDWKYHMAEATIDIIKEYCEMEDNNADRD